MKISLHIGAPKTGSTSIQHFLSDNAGALAERGDLVPEAVGRVSHWALSLYAGSVWRRDSLRRAHSLADPAQFRAWRTAFPHTLRREVETLGAARLLLSSEFLYQRLSTTAEIRRLAEVLTGLAPSVEIEILVYLRRQDRMALAMYASAARHGAESRFRFPPRGRAGLYDFDVRLQRWETVFGRECLHVVAFEPERLIGGNVVADYAARAGVDLAGLVLPKAANPSPGAAVIEFMRRINAHLPRFVDNAPNPARGDLGDIVEALRVGGPRLRAPRAEAAAFLDRFAAGNARLVERYGEGAAFSALGSEPEQALDADDEPLDTDTAIRIAAALWAYQEARRQPQNASTPSHSGLNPEVGDRV